MKHLSILLICMTICILSSCTNKNHEAKKPRTEVWLEVNSRGVMAVHSSFDCEKISSGVCKRPSIELKGQAAAYCNKCFTEDMILKIEAGEPY